MATQTLSSLDARSLARRLGELAGDERHVQVEFLLHLDEFDRRRAWLELGYGSLWTYCLEVLHLREGAAGRRIAAMRVRPSAAAWRRREAQGGGEAGAEGRAEGGALEGPGRDLPPRSAARSGSATAAAAPSRGRTGGAAAAAGSWRWSTGRVSLLSMEVAQEHGLRRGRHTQPDEGQARRERGTGRGRLRRRRLPSLPKAEAAGGATAPSGPPSGRGTARRPAGHPGEQPRCREWSGTSPRPRPTRARRGRDRA